MTPEVRAEFEARFGKNRRSFLSGLMATSAMVKFAPRDVERYFHGESTRFTGWSMADYAEYRKWALGRNVLE